ncbi:MAG: TIGR02099 family protein [Rhodoferax sp.]|nr:TIGR02099 family protein [Rhodoferax sp.]
MTVAKVISTPPRWLKVAAFTARASLTLLATAWIVLLTVWSALHFIIVPRIAEFRPLLQEQASRMLGVSVQIGDIVATSNGVIPSFELSQVSLFDAQGHEVLKLPRILVALSARSLLVLGLEQLTFDGPVLNVRRAPDGQIWVAGVALPKDEKGGSTGTDWIFSQPELAIRNGTVTWTDELRAAPALTLTGVDWVLRNQQRGHAMRLEANPPPAWGKRLGLSGLFKQRLLSLHAGAWREWDGVLFADLPQTDLSHVRNYADLGVHVVQGVGALRVWADVHQGAFTGAIADVALHRVQVMVKPELEALGLSQVSGRLGVKVLADGLEFSTQALQFDTEDGLHWPGGNVRVALFTGDARRSASGELVADRLDLAALARIASRLPLDESVHTHLQGLSPKGLIERLEGSWQGSIEELSQFAVKGRAVGLELAPQAAERGAEQGIRPGFGGADIDFDFNQQGGRARIAVHQGRIDAPGLFEDPLIELEQLSGNAQWKIDGQHISLAVSDLHFGNADLQGVAQLKWQTDAATPLPGLIDLQGNLSRAEANRVFRYLPLPISKDVRDYVRDAISTGTASQVRFKVKGALQDFPYTAPKSGEFRITASLQDVDYAYVPYVPANPTSDNDLPWPALSGLDAELVIDHTSLQVKGARSKVAGFAGLQLNKIDSVIHDLYGNASVTVNASAQGPLADMLGLVNRSPLATLTGKVLANATATGQADYRFKLGIPLDAVERASVQGSVALTGNDLQLSSTIPRLARARGTVSFSENGFSVANGQARVLGGDMRIDGGWSNSGASKPLAGALRLQGIATVEGIRQARELGFVSRLAQYASGSASYSAVLGSRAGMPELLVTSNLVGLALNLPAPFMKTAEAVMPLRLETTVVRSSPFPPFSPLQDQLQLELGQSGRLGSVVYVRDISGAEPRVVRGAVALGLAADESVSMPTEGVTANVNVASLDLDAWSDVASRLAASEPPASPASSASSTVSMGYLPNKLALRVGELTMGGRKLNRVFIGSGRDGLLWRANLDASELNGYVEYRQSTGPAAGRLYARLARLAIAQSAAQDVENLLDEQPASIPALDVVVEDFELRGKKLGRMEVDAVNLSAAAGGGAREWRLNRFNIRTPEAVLEASGNWANVTSAAPAAGRSIRERRRTLMNFRLEISDAGELLNRFGMRDVVRKGRGKIEGQVAWMGSPITLDYASMSGNFNVLVENGQFLKTEPGIAKLLGVLSLQALPRRLTLDFRDVFSQGFSFDFVRGDVTIEQGIAKTNNLQMKGVNAAVLMEGQADIAHETQNIKVVVIPEINAGSASLIASAINPMVGLSTFLAQLILRKPLIEAATQEFVVDGSWLDPRVTKVKRNMGNFAKPEGIQ